MTQAKNIMVSSYARTKEASQAKYISILNIIQGEVDPTQVSWHSCKVSVHRRPGKICLLGWVVKHECFNIACSVLLFWNFFAIFGQRNWDNFVFLV
jgi:hypothetical protein